MADGHGWVYPRPDGVQARCGGPSMCPQCAEDLARKRSGEARTQEPCPKCGAVDQGQTGKYPCSECGLPAVWDEPANEPSRYDSRIDTFQHIQTVQRYLNWAIRNLLLRSQRHDQSKLASPEVEIFDEMTPLLAGCTYGSEEYKRFLEKMKGALDHHYAVNSHHPEHYGYLECNGCFKRFPKSHGDRCDACGYAQFTFRPDIAGMSLLDLIEMLVDWKAATLRHNDGDLAKSIEINQQRFGYGDDLKRILVNTARELGLFDTEYPSRIDGGLAVRRGIAAGPDSLVTRIRPHGTCVKAVP